MRGLLVALGFLTRIPVPLRVLTDRDAQPRSLPWYPLVGVILGGLLLLSAWWLHGTSPLLVAALLLIGWVGLSGALHLDGLADSADAWVGGMGDRARTLAIMKDPACGPMGVAAVVLVLLLKFSALASLARADWPVLLLAPLLARAALVAAFLWLPYVRSQGLGSGLLGASRTACGATLLLSWLVCLLFAWRGLLAVLASVLVFVLWRRACLQRLGGMTGDTCGALTELVEAAVLLAWLLGK